MSRSAELIGLTVLAFALWYFVFQSELWNFWARLSLAAATLALSTLILTPDRAEIFRVRPRDLVLGVASALVLYAIFWLGQQLALWVLPFASEQIGRVYANRGQLDPLWIGLLLFFLVGPSEEIFWRGFVQRRLSKHFSPLGALLTTTALYAFVHIWTLNLILILAAFVVGLFWGWLYWRVGANGRSPLPSVMLSHALWDVLIFVIWPLM